MNFNNFTLKSQESVQKAMDIAVGKQNQAIETVHILKGMLISDENVIPYLLKKLNVNLERLNQVLDRNIDDLPKITGGSLISSPVLLKPCRRQAYAQEFMMILSQPSTFSWHFIGK